MSSIDCSQTFINGILQAGIQDLPVAEAVSRALASAKAEIANRYAEFDFASAKEMESNFDWDAAKDLAARAWMEEFGLAALEAKLGTAMDFGQDWLQGHISSAGLHATVLEAAAECFGYFAGYAFDLVVDFADEAMAEFFDALEESAGGLAGAIRAWDGVDVSDLLSDLQSLKSAVTSLRDNNSCISLEQFVDMPALPHGDRLPVGVERYPCWTMDADGWCLVGDLADEIEHIDDVLARYKAA